MKLPINEIFETIQGEAYWTGTPSVFIRLQGCAVGCPWCDTKHTWAVEPDKQLPLSAIIAKTGDGASYALSDASEVARAAEDFSARHAVITGGEPCDYDLNELAFSLMARGFTVQVETSGTSEISIPLSAWVTVSPKIDMPGGKVVLPSAIMRADEIKMPVGKPQDVERLKTLLASNRYHTPMVWLQPLSQSDKATALCVAVATKENWRLSLQTHKFLGVR